MTLFAVAVCSSFALAAGRSVYADVREVGLDVGHQLAQLEDVTSDGHLIEFNGALMHRSSAYATQDPHLILDRFENYCRLNAGAVTGALLNIRESLKDQIDMPKGPTARTAILREERDGRGMLACFVDDERSTPTSLAVRLKALIATGDLATLGHFRYVFTERSGSADGGTHVVTFWSEGPLVLKQLFPSSGDAPGEDSRVAPRPNRSRRILVASTDSYPAAVRIYESEETRAEATDHYKHALELRGFRPVETPSTATNTAYIREDGAHLFVSMASSGDRTAITVIESQSPNAAIRAEQQP
jgi:hypothetical protein